MVETSWASTTWSRPFQNADKAFGGHLEPDTTMYTFAMVTLGVLDEGLDLSKIDDWNYR